MNKPHKRLFLGALLLVFSISLTGCSSIIEKEYVSVSNYDSGLSETNYDNEEGITSYIGLYAEITRMVRQHLENETLTFSNYSGDIEEDVAEACWGVKASSALADFCVDYITYDIRHIVSYYEADISIVYKKSADEVNSIINLYSISGAEEYIVATMEELKTETIIHLSSTTIDEAEVSEYVEKVYRDNPLILPSMPSIEVVKYSGSGPEAIFSIKYSYPYGENLANNMLTELKSESTDLISNISKDASKASQALHLVGLLNSACLYSENSEEIYSDTAWGALTNGVADSKGFAMAYKVMCDMLEIPCQVVKGRYEKNLHYWNIIELNDEWYHVDASRAKLDGSFIRNDKDVWGAYWWETDEYPVCNGELTYDEIIGANDVEETINPENENNEEILN